MPSNNENTTIKMFANSLRKADYDVPFFQYYGLLIKNAHEDRCDVWQFTVKLLRQNVKII